MRLLMPFGNKPAFDNQFRYFHGCTNGADRCCAIANSWVIKHSWMKAMNSIVHSNTPILAIIDPRALAVRNVQFCRSVAGQLLDARVTHQRFDWSGRPVVGRDPRLFSRSEIEAGIPANLVVRFSLSGAVLLNESVDSG
ncbi:putative insecticidal toxin protein, partial [Pseudomonas savastanoi pv. glycinea]